MIIEEIVLDNFGIYKDHHVVKLAPTSQKAIILLGGLNGSGKTTLLDALQLALYGKFSRHANRVNMNYIEYLRRMINHHADPKKGASLKLQFKHFREGKEESIRIHRSWYVSGKGFKENVEVERDGVLDSVLTERWYEYVEEFIPNRISSLFFFDGEKIEGLADANKTAALVKTGIHALLGLDLVDRLSADLLTVERKHKTEIQPPESRVHIAALEAEIEQLSKQVKDIAKQKLDVQRSLAQKEQDKKKLLEEYRREGGELFDERAQIEAELDAAQDKLSFVEKQMREIATGDAPLLMVGELLSETKSQALLEEEAKHNGEIYEELEKHNVAILDLLKQHAVKPTTLKAVQAFINADKKNRKESIKTKCYLNAEPMIFSRLQDNIFDQIQTSVTEFIAQAEEVTEEINSCERKLGSIPDPESLEGITQQIKDIQEEIGNAKLQFELLIQEYKRIRNEIVHKKTELTQSYELEASEKFTYEANHLLIERTEKVRYTLEKFGLAVTTKHIRQLELLILESFSQLIRKEDFINKIEIDPNDYTLTLYTPNHEKLSPKSLSAGERQLLAVSVLWGLSRASGRPLPTIIDTPLSRLDGKHRQNLVDNYFYQASHQVILLSTDEEINEKYYNDLKSAVGREYHITYEEDKQSAVIKKGYFF